MSQEQTNLRSVQKILVGFLKRAAFEEKPLAHQEGLLRAYGYKRTILSRFTRRTNNSVRSSPSFLKAKREFLEDNNPNSVQPLLSSLPSLGSIRNILFFNPLLRTRAPSYPKFHVMIWLDSISDSAEFPVSRSSVLWAREKLENIREVDPDNASAERPATDTNENVQAVHPSHIRHGELSEDPSSPGWAGNNNNDPHGGRRLRRRSRGRKTRRS
jgi:hypothetical protein